MRAKIYLLIIMCLVIILVFQGKHIIERSNEIYIMEKSSAEKSLNTDNINNDAIKYYKDFSFYNVVEAAYSIDKKARLTKIEKTSDNSFTITITFNNKEVNVNNVVYRLQQIKYFYKIDNMVQDDHGNASITFVFNNLHKV